MASPRIALHLKKNKSDSANYRTKGTLSISISAVTHYVIQHSHHSLSRWVCPNRYESKEGILSSAKLNPNAPSNLVSVTGSWGRTICNQIFKPPEQWPRKITRSGSERIEEREHNNKCKIKTQDKQVHKIWTLKSANRENEWKGAGSQSCGYHKV